MAEQYRIVLNDVSKKDKAPLDFINSDITASAQKFHASFPQYEPTPLVELKNLAALLGVKDIFVKDESYRFGLNAFKVLGGSFAIGKYIAEKLGMDIEDLPFEKLTSQDVKDQLGDITFVTATDGNHGRGVAWAAKALNQKCVVIMPNGSALERRDNIRALGAQCDIMDGLNYDDCVRLANQYAEEKGWVMVQDTAWEGYEKIPTWIIQGYATLAKEAYDQLLEKGQHITHIFVQAGVGSFATGVTGFFSSVLTGDKKPLIAVVEPEKANCNFITAEADDGKIHNVTGEMNTIMAGLACGEPVTVGWPILSSYADAFLSVPDKAAARGMRVLGNPLKDDQRIISGESGAATTGVVTEILQRDDLKSIKEQLQLDENSVILLFSTEGDTDFEHYRKVVWDGYYTNDDNYNYTIIR
ncbi:diaminopropionate ammonia-lyase [Peptoniphilus equinus]|uniref:Diaminopropionate ammonia-lyase n=1 Tax=Peptoniphilus equinus TaxID=3016343 RepID=A0ABY7QWH9_9FIRM|nr:diaminopropionate ammonia-lyase [Peptoniphilus equinus]WBW50573.1 diaminopropionate ammonia-lyase [Peptoniphilus equinus]